MFGKDIRNDGGEEGAGKGLEGGPIRCLLLEGLEGR